MLAPEYYVKFNDKKGKVIKVKVGERGIWEFYFKCGDRYISKNGSISLFCEVPKFWLTINPQIQFPSKEEYISVVSPIKNCIEAVSQYYKNLEWIRIKLPEGMKKGEWLKIKAGTKRSPFYIYPHIYPQVPVSFGIDYEADGNIFKLWPPLVIEVLPDKPEYIRGVIPTCTEPGKEFILRVRFEDINRNIISSFPKKRKIEINLVDMKGNIISSQKIFTDKGIFSAGPFVVSKKGFYRFLITSGSIKGTSNWIRVEKKKTYILWGDCHNHTGWADGIGTMYYNIDFAKNKSFIDVFAISEHIKMKSKENVIPVVDKQGSDAMLFGLELEEIYKREETKNFIILRGYEYREYKSYVKKEPTGDHCVFWKGNWLNIPCALELADMFALAKREKAIIIPHVGGATPRVYNINYPPSVSPLIEISSMHGHFEWFAQAGLQAGNRFGFCGMSDGHFGMPGYDNWALHGRTSQLKKRNFSVPSPLTAFICKNISKDSVFESMKERATYVSTGGLRPFIEFKINEFKIGEEGTTRDIPSIYLWIIGEVKISRIDLIRGDRTLKIFDDINKYEVKIEFKDEFPLKFSYYYFRITFEDFNLAWTSPIWIKYRGKIRSNPEVLPKWNEASHWPRASIFKDSQKKIAIKSLKRLLKKRDLQDRFKDIEFRGIFRDMRGEFFFYFAKDTLRDDRFKDFFVYLKEDHLKEIPVHIKYYIDLKPERLYICNGYGIYGSLPQ